VAVASFEDAWAAVGQTRGRFSKGEARVLLELVRDVPYEHCIVEIGSYC
jgi:hypothetical protein